MAKKKSGGKKQGLRGKTLGERLRFVREREGLPVRQAAEFAGVSAAYWSLIERGQRVPALGKLQAIGEAFGVSLDLLVGQRI